MDTLEMSAFVSYLSATRKELFVKLTPYEWEDVLDSILESYVGNGEVLHLKDIAYDSGYKDGHREASSEYAYEYDRGYDKGQEDGYQEGYSVAKSEFNEPAV